MNIAPIETVWRGYRFRSRLEARWAVFFETCGLLWEYEPEGFYIDTTPYLPDFKIFFPTLESNGGCDPYGVSVLAEVKPEKGDFKKILLMPGPLICLEGVPDERRKYKIKGNGISDFVSFEEMYGVGWKTHPFYATNAARSVRFEHGERPI